MRRMRVFDLLPCVILHYSRTPILQFFTHRPTDPPSHRDTVLLSPSHPAHAWYGDLIGGSFRLATEFAQFLASRGHRVAYVCCAAAEKGSGAFCRNGPEGATHKRSLTPFPLSDGRGRPSCEAGVLVYRYPARRPGSLCPCGLYHVLQTRTAGPPVGSRVPHHGDQRPQPAAVPGRVPGRARHRCAAQLHGPFAVRRRTAGRLQPSRRWSSRCAAPWLAGSTAEISGGRIASRRILSTRWTRCTGNTGGGCWIEAWWRPVGWISKRSSRQVDRAVAHCFGRALAVRRPAVLHAPATGIPHGSGYPDRRRRPAAAARATVPSADRRRRTAGRRRWRTMIRDRELEEHVFLLGRIEQDGSPRAMRRPIASSCRLEPWSASA
jgi:hypothetical protein